MTDMSPPTIDTGPSANAKTIAAGGQPQPWSETFTHPIHGPLTFTAKLPVARQLMLHQVLLDEQLSGLTLGEARSTTQIFAAALAGLMPIEPDDPSQGCLIKLPVIAETIVPTETGQITQRTYYSAEDEINPAWLVGVWIAFSNWRQDILKELDAVKGSLGGLQASGNDSSESSSEPTVSRSTIPA